MRGGLTLKSTLGHMRLRAKGSEAGRSMQKVTLLIILAGCGGLATRPAAVLGEVEAVDAQGLVRGWALGDVALFVDSETAPRATVPAKAAHDTEGDHGF